MLQRVTWGCLVASGESWPLAGPVPQPSALCNRDAAGQAGQESVSEGDMPQRTHSRTVNQVMETKYFKTGMFFVLTSFSPRFYGFVWTKLTYWSQKKVYIKLTLCYQSQTPSTIAIAWVPRERLKVHTGTSVSFGEAGL